MNRSSALSNSSRQRRHLITIPADVRQSLQVKAGDRVEFVLIEPGRFDRRHQQGDCGTGCIGTMIGLDTNVLVGYIMQDDAKQSAKANTLIESLSADEPGFILPALRALTRMTVTSRYPLEDTAPMDLYDKADSELAIATATAVLTWVERLDQEEG